MNMPIIKPYNYYNSPFHSKPSKSSSYNNIPYLFHTPKPCISMTISHPKMVAVRALNGDEDDGETTSERRGFLSLEEAGLVEISGLNTHERFLCRLTISSLNLLRVIGEQEGCKIEELNAGKLCDWFLKDKLKREQNIGDPVLQWDVDDPFEDFL
ncbi:hypothetical protein RND81_06G118700 [Saponaria officinalis]|uniref:Uncharacterized protein n=1 Tax=Saponaria officinalis TaxID=3572 RepID=A0AAW1KAL9_SAPOF